MHVITDFEPECTRSTVYTVPVPGKITFCMTSKAASVSLHGVECI